MKKLITLLAIVALFGSCKKETVAPATTTSMTQQSKLFTVELQSSEPTGPYFGYIVEVNGSFATSPANVYPGDSVKVSVYNSLGNPFILKCYLNNTNVYPNGNYQYSDVSWIYNVN